MNIKDFMEAVDYRITEGSEYSWNCYSPKAYSLDSWNGNQDGYSVCMVFDTDTQVVYEVTANDYKNNRAYRWINPDFTEAHKAEVEIRGFEDSAWDNVNYIDLEVEEDLISKINGMVNNTDYDTRIQVPLELPDSVMFKLMKGAHEKDMTLNKFVEDILKNELDYLRIE